jgi:DNA-binding NtrC family response regulator
VIEPFSLRPERVRSSRIVKRKESPLATSSQPHFSAGKQPGILVVDDDALVLNLLHTLLRRQGFTVWLAAGGTAAVEVFRREQANIAAVLLDVRMPGLDGPQTLAELRRIRPDLPCCFMSGCTDPYTTEDLMALGVAHLFPKPFPVDEVGLALARLAGRAA